MLLTHPHRGQDGLAHQLRVLRPPFSILLSLFGFFGFFCTPATPSPGIALACYGTPPGSDLKSLRDHHDGDKSHTIRLVAIGGASTQLGMASRSGLPILHRLQTLEIVTLTPASYSSRQKSRRYQQAIYRFPLQTSGIWNCSFRCGLLAVP
ncbi:hypothetical protein B0H63DRAFT_182421 [Podospora didyma]|uniref:Uncharacterized protein n=1 Tax=Podospora didyma TaxID=330526 RepID=A0AAE0TZQ6_9PEZI|nr:hypothetical protein B0H63DRAFT_182421 [Podospora didyma]